MGANIHDYLRDLIAMRAFTRNELVIECANKGVWSGREIADAVAKAKVVEPMQTVPVQTPNTTTITNGFQAKEPKKQSPISSAVLDYLSEEQELETKWFMFSPLVQMTMPHSDPGTDQYARTNGITDLTWISKEGIPYGKYARMLMLYMSSMAVKLNSPNISLGSSRRELVRVLGYTPSGELFSSIGEQINRLRSSFLTLEQKQELLNQKKVLQFKNIRLFSEGETWWDGTTGDGGAHLTFSPEFYELLRESAAPFSHEAIMKLKSSCLAMDVYCFFAYRSRIGSIKAPIPWEGLQAQFGVGDLPGRRFREEFRKAIAMALPYLPGIRLVPLDRGVLISRSQAG